MITLPTLQGSFRQKGETELSTKVTQFDWAFVTGDGTGKIGKNISFDHEFADAPIPVGCVYIGREATTSGTPDGADFFTEDVGGDIIGISLEGISTTGFTAYVKREGANTLASTKYWGFTWAFIGELA